MSETTPESPPTEGARRLHAVVRSLLSPGIWLVLGMQILLVMSLPWRVPEGATPVEAALTLAFPVAGLLAFFFLQAGVFHALTQGRSSLMVGEALRAAPKVFGSYLWLMTKALLLFVLIMNVLTLVILLMTGIEIESLMKRLAAFFNPLTGILAFVFAYWLPYVFVQSDFRLLPSLQRALDIARQRLAQMGFLVLLILAPVALAAMLPTGIPYWIHLLLNAVSGMMGWIAYVYCVDVVQSATSMHHASSDKSLFS